MDRLFGRSKPKQPAPNLTDCVANVSCVLVIPVYKIRKNTSVVVKDLRLKDEDKDKESGFKDKDDP